MSASQLFSCFQKCKTVFPFTCRWKFNGKDFDTYTDLNYSLVEGNLLINNPQAMKDGGSYQCIATNAFGTILSRKAKVEFACE